MSGWIKVDKELTDSIRFRRMLKAYRHALRGVTERDVTGDESLLLGALIRLWMYADSHIGQDNILAVSLDEIDEIVGVQGFGQCLPADWLKVLDTDHVELPDFLEHNGTSAKQRKDAAKRQANHRWRKKQQPVTRDVTNSNARNDARPDQTRPEETRPENKTRAREVDPVSRETSDAEIFERVSTLKAKYPPNAGREDWINAERSARRLVDDGLATWAALEAGLERYAAHCRKTGRAVMNPANFFGAEDKPWSQAWPIPPTKAQRAQASTVEAAVAWLKDDHAAVG